MHPNLNVETVVSLPYEENTYLVHKPDAAQCLIIDPGFEPAKVFACLEQGQWEPDAILNTHGHSDHIAGNGALKERWPDCPLIIGRGDAEKLTDPRQNLSANHGLGLTSPAADRLVGEGDTICRAAIELHVLETPGHSAGHVIFVWKEAAPFVVFGGDVLFAGSVGRSDFVDGDFDALVASIHQKLFVLPDDTIVYPGHGPATTIGREKQINPFVGLPAGYHFDGS